MLSFASKMSRSFSLKRSIFVAYQLYPLVRGPWNWLRRLTSLLVARLPQSRSRLNAGRRALCFYHVEEVMRAYVIGHPSSNFHFTKSTAILRRFSSPRSSLLLHRCPPCLIHQRVKRNRQHGRPPKFLRSCTYLS